MGLRPIINHPWDVSTAEARAIQEKLRKHVSVLPLDRSLEHPVRIVAGVDVSIKEGMARAAVVMLSYPELTPFEAATAVLPTPFPYVPGLLAFREGPVVLAALDQLDGLPDVLMFDAQGRAHPRRMGLATHLGVILDTPSVGCAKSRLTGRQGEPGAEKGCWAALRDDDEVIGAVVRTRTRVKPVFVSVGHRVDLAGAIDLVLTCAPKYRIPEPIRWAHRIAGGDSLPA